MSASLGEPILLVSYIVPSSLRKGKRKEVALDECPFVYASFSNVPGRRDEHVNLAVRGNGIHIYELGDLHPISSRTFGPSTSFASAPATIIHKDGESNARRIYAAIKSSQDVKNEDAGRVIWTWKEPVSGRVGSSQDRQLITLPHDVAYLMTLQDVNSILAVSRSGTVTWLDLDLNTKNSWSLGDASLKVIKSFAFPARDCNFLQSGLSNEYAAAIVLEHDGKLLVRVLIFGVDNQLSSLDPFEIPFEGVDRVLDISLDPSGNMSILGSNGTWNGYLLGLKNNSIGVSDSYLPLRLKSLTFIDDNHHTLPSVSIVNLSSSFVLLAGTTAKEIALLLWDLQFDVLLHSVTLPIPSNLGNSSNGVSVQLSVGTGSQALLILSPRAEESKSDRQMRSSVLVVPFSVPGRSTIADALGKAAQSALWLADAPTERKERHEDEYGREAMLSNLKDAIDKGQAKQVEGIFFSWLRQHDEQLKVDEVAPAAEGGDSNDLKDVELEEVDIEKSKGTKKAAPLKSILDHAFVTRILSTMLPTEKPLSKPYCQKICRHLVTKHLVSHGMVQGGLLEALVQRNDWETVRECFSYVVDLPENELLRLLHIVVKHHRKRTEKDAMELVKLSKKRHRGDEHWHSIPSVTVFLAFVVDYPATQAAWRTALRENFADMEDLRHLLVIADGWIDTYTKKGLPVGLGIGEATQNEHGVFILEDYKNKKTVRIRGMPSSENLLAFVQAILDSSFLAVLQSSESHPLLQRMSENISQLQSIDLELQGLLGPLEPFARAQNKALAEAKRGGKGKKREEVDWRKRRKQAHEQAALGLGPYQVEELIF